MPNKTHTNNLSVAFNSLGLECYQELSPIKEDWE